MEIKTQQTDHATIGHDFKGWNKELYVCNGWVKDQGFWMVNLNNPQDNHCISERAIGRTYHHAWASCRKCNIDQL